MERLQHLISKLNEQNQQKESPLQMLVTLKHIEAELTIIHTAGGATRLNPGVSVVMPSINIGARKTDKPVAAVSSPAAADRVENIQPAVPAVNEVFTAQPVPEPQPAWSTEKQTDSQPVTAFTGSSAGNPSVKGSSANGQPVNGQPAGIAPPANAYRNGASTVTSSHTSPAAEALKKYQPQTGSSVTEPVVSSQPAAAGGTPSAPQAWSVDPLSEVPTLSHQPGAPELNDIIGLRNPSINDRLKDNGLKETGYQLKGAPVKELRKAIGVNDRYLFINELFRGDEVMYERSIKTINNFRILPEAQYWMERELKIKIGWDDSRDIVQHFYELVSRRFS